MNPNCRKWKLYQILVIEEQILPNVHVSIDLQKKMAQTEFLNNIKNLEIILKMFKKMMFQDLDMANLI